MWQGAVFLADALAGSAIRMIPCCLAFGQAAGTAATLSLKKHINPVDVCVGELRACLENRMFILEENKMTEIQYQRILKVRKEYDVLVAGAGQQGSVLQWQQPEKA